MALALRTPPQSSALEWYTELDRALAVAGDRKVPVLSLRLLGRLDEELSCANSRFYRTLIYPSAKVSDRMRTQFVLHWESVCPVPKMTIDFGNGRKLESTIIGNSAHLVLDQQGRTVDVLPGLMSANAFLARLAFSTQLVESVASKNAHAWQTEITKRHQARAKTILHSWRAKLAEVGAPSSTIMSIHEQLRRDELVTAHRMLVDSTDWTRLANTERDRPDLIDPETERRIISERSTQTRNAENAGRIAATKRMVEFPHLKQLGQLRLSLAEDTFRNGFDLSSQIHLGFARSDTTSDPKDVIRWLYDQIFLMPLDDPWLGMSPEDTYTALRNHGRI